jgi:asparagine synthase (glutamine-hydrolysing)
MACTFDVAADEVTYARALGERWNTNIREVAPLLPAQGWFAARANAWQDFPGYPSSAMVEPLLAKASAAGSRVILNGIGGDQWGTGARVYYAEELVAGDWHGLGASLSADIASFGLRTTLYWLCRFGFFMLLPEALQQRMLSSVRKWRGRPQALDELFWLAPSRHEILQARKTLLPVVRVPKPGQHELMDILNGPFFAWALGVGGRIYAHHEIEGRSPFSTAPVLQFMLSMPEKLRLRGAVHKYIHVQALGDLLPAVIAQRQTKAEFSVAFRRPLDAMEQLCTEQIPQQHPDWVTADGMAELYRLYKEGKSGGWPQFFLWAIYAGHLFRKTGFASRAEND